MPVRPTVAHTIAAARFSTRRTFVTSHIAAGHATTISGRFVLFAGDAARRSPCYAPGTLLTRHAPIGAVSTGAPQAGARAQLASERPGTPSARFSRHSRRPRRGRAPWQYHGQVFPQRVGAGHGGVL